MSHEIVLHHDENGDLICPFGMRIRCPLSFDEDGRDVEEDEFYDWQAVILETKPLPPQARCGWVPGRGYRWLLLEKCFGRMSAEEAAEIKVLGLGRR